MQRQMYVLVALALVALLAVSLIAACGKAAEPAGSGALDGEALAKERCSACHSFDQVENAKKTPEEWKANVERMVAKGAKLNAQEQEAVIEFLSEAHPK
jgi:cytochrome c2